ncbi:MAG: alpha/beta fold hydrolase [Reyranella sp.]|uniref:alpha/beta hydrolase family protein n=1 Tax=Reyranella sp. TaxID=1929291 RepID=UPI0012226431|nr:alpha/beta fold hydrolase [Reyranella sp.]TAJ36889.1 MAG: alpha/beta fold hydrolase [Reyranella sp.]
MIGRRALLAAGALTPLVAGTQSSWAQSPWKGYYATGMKHRAVRFAGAGGAMLAGTLLLPRWSELQKVPGVVLIAGSGPTDRDGNNPLIAERPDLLKQIAELLAAAGIASLRYDKRGIGASTPRPTGALEEQERFFVWDNFVGDVAAAHGELLRHDEIKPYATALLGHSEGGLLALAAAGALAARTMGPRRLHGLVLAATPGRPLADIVRAQIARGAPPLVEPVERTISAIMTAGRVPAGLPREQQLLFPPYAGPFLQSALAFDPAKALAGLDLACLILQGGADRQVVPMADIQPLIDALGQRTAPGEALIAAGVSHNLKLITWPTSPGFAGPVAPVIADKLTSWLRPLLGA